MTQSFFSTPPTSSVLGFSPFNPFAPAAETAETTSATTPVTGQVEADTCLSESSAPEQAAQNPAPALPTAVAESEVETAASHAPVETPVDSALKQTETDSSAAPLVPASPGLEINPDLSPEVNAVSPSENPDIENISIESPDDEEPAELLTRDAVDSEPQETETAAAPQNTPATAAGFTGLNLIPEVLSAIQALGYENPTPIQAQMIPHMLEGRDVLGQAQTGTGKTAAFALPLLSIIDESSRNAQVLVLTPTRELAIQVAEAFESYAAKLPVRVCAIYGGQSYEPQHKQLRKGPQVIVGTPGRVMDHMRKGTLDLDSLTTLVLDEADEMLRMGFLEDVEWILEQLPEEHQIALFSATMPSAIRRLAQNYLNNPVEITVKSETLTATSIEQVWWQVRGMSKTDALVRILEAETYDGVMIFVRTKADTVTLADALMSHGFAVAALNGDMPQNLREQTVERLRKGLLDILVATDVAARGLDVERLSHVINYDMPQDGETYTHRIGRTGRAGRAGKAILFVKPSERFGLREIERTTKQEIKYLTLPDAETLNRKRIEMFENRITRTLRSKDIDFFKYLVAEYVREHEVEPLEVAAALAVLQQGDKPLLLPPDPPELFAPPEAKGKKLKKTDRKGDAKGEKKGRQSFSNEGLVTYRVEVGHKDRINPGQLVGAIANEAQLDSSSIGRIEIFPSFSTVDLPESMEAHLVKTLARTQVNGRLLKIRRDQGPPTGRKGFEDRPKKGFKSGGGSFKSRKAQKPPKRGFRKV